MKNVSRNEIYKYFKIFIKIDIKRFFKKNKKIIFFKMRNTINT